MDSEENNPIWTRCNIVSNSEFQDILAIDFETANLKRTACSVGIVREINSKQVYEAHILINPEEEFDIMSTWVHGITPSQVVSSPSFAIVGKTLLENITPQTTIIAHNAKFDMDVLHRALMRYNISTDPVPYLCTVKLADGLIDLPSCNLAALSRRLDFTLDHHNALSDAKGSLAVFNHLKRILQENNLSLDAYLKQNNITPGTINHKQILPITGRLPKLYQLPKPSLGNARSLNGKSFCFAGDLSHWTKRQAEKLVQDRGGEIRSRMSHQVDYFVIGNRGFFSSPEAWDYRVQRAHEFSSTSPRMKVITEERFNTGMTTLLERNQ